ncbi:MAG TPA: preprotein translocase subunit SecG [Steroidobacteraceae bacterium]|jgi:preprotein translocase subunit SecG|nr:preprotein translocase subunit SecG [Steroidobacteraceae bacterium]
MLHFTLTIVQVIASLAIIALVLLQRGKGADAGAGFGAGASGTVFGARGASTALSRATAIFAAIFMLNSLALAYMGAHVATDQPKTILDEAAATRRPAPLSSVPGIPAPAPPSATSAPVPAPAAPAAPATPPK